MIVVNSFLNHQVDSVLLKEVGEEFGRRFAKTKATKVLTAETSGLPPALATGMALSIAMIYARKEKPVTMIQKTYAQYGTSPTKGNKFELLVAAEFLTPEDRILIIDDILGTGATSMALASLVRQSGAKLVGIGHVIEKSFVGGGASLAILGVPMESLVKIKAIEDSVLVLG
jgi:xanthine phosphoribosyltransferase